MAADQDNSLLKGLSIGAGSIAGLGGLLFANKKLGLLGKLVNKFKKPELKGIQLLGKPFVKSDFKPGSPTWKEAKKNYKVFGDNLPLLSAKDQDDYIGSIYKTLVQRQNGGYTTYLDRGESLFSNFNKAVENQLNQIQQKLSKNNIEEYVFRKNYYSPTTFFNKDQFIKDNNKYVWKLINPHDRPQQKLNKEDRSLIAALLRLTKDQGNLRTKHTVDLSLSETKPQTLSLWEKLIQNKPLQLGPYWQYLDGKISRIPQQ